MGEGPTHQRHSLGVTGGALLTNRTSTSASASSSTSAGAGDGAGRWRRSGAHQACTAVSQHDASYAYASHVDTYIAA